jgi:L-threonylcarbamoyladenylate synthase
MAPPGSKRHGILPATADNIATAADLLLNGELVAFPTETVYGLGADATNDRAVAAIFAAKNRPTINPLIVHLPDADTARRYVEFEGRADRLAAFWPGALTLVLPRRRACGVSLLASAGLDTLAIRVPRHPVAQALLAACGRPIAAPSANVSGRVSPTTAEHVARSVGDKVSIILNGGACRIGIESTVVDLSTSEPKLLRLGGVTEEQLANAIGPVRLASPGDTRRSPGMMASHYAPSKPLRINATALRPGEALLAFGPRTLENAAVVLNLSAAGDVTEAAANLFAMLRALDDTDAAGIAIMPIPDTGLGRAINDRLRRAAGPS